MNARIDFFANPVAGKVLRHINSAGRAAGDALSHTTQELVKIRASQINGCGFCTDMHTKDAAAAGETQLRLNLVATWREATVFTEAERAALELAEQGTRIADAAGGVTDEAWANAAKHYNEDELAALISLIAIINAYNRINVINQQPAGDYQPGQFG
ncbi:MULTISPECIES: carboxymuconolactone decarboxylase family protein [Streptomyces]|uniref:Carboxymuconolactone decarboxylase family protein n=2 Tax=Streptomyces TaxID=1883 RepID=A0AB39NXU9_9ACTN|nr:MULTISPECIES: carboxymuconolactone decarboxylase family protein [Streptomyces]MCI4146405.1 carboxymuconolactone decarboxylase family protein [Streptomyces sp. MMS20-AI2-20]GGQ06083.1 alkyl hydroperoxide reductase AhpD [Streptomyces gancidicus]GGS61914.1 alkyl hydroperoxide reductase AhpD [Streptomyces rubiginosus]